MITQEDRLKYPYHNDAAILGCKMIGGLSDAALERLLDEIRTESGGQLLAAIELLMNAGGRSTNPAWIVGRILEESYERGMIPAQVMDWLGR